MGNTVRLLPSALVAGLVFLGMTVPGSALAQGQFEQHMGEAQRLYEETEYERALLELQRAQRYAQSDEQLSRLAIYEGLIRAEKRELKKARSLFEVGLQKNPWAALPVKVSPKLEAVFEKVRDSVLQKLKIEVSPEAMAGLKMPFATTDRPAAIPKMSWNTPLKPYSKQEETWIPVPFNCRSEPVASIVWGGVGGAALVGAVAFGVQSHLSVKNAEQAFRRSEAESHLNTARKSALISYGSAASVALAAGLSVFTYVKHSKKPFDRVCAPEGGKR